ncbi:hypothetical protein [Ruegeria sp. SCP11]|uniref:hypothetical protein n=1 Tax=Ruegeria sp. SCP11 TaxID=3141378 RepID=UPI0033357A76
MQVSIFAPCELFLKPCCQIADWKADQRELGEAEEAFDGFVVAGVDGTSTHQPIEALFSQFAQVIYRATYTDAPLAQFPHEMAGRISRVLKGFRMLSAAIPRSANKTHGLSQLPTMTISKPRQSEFSSSVVSVFMGKPAALEKMGCWASNLHKEGQSPTADSYTIPRRPMLNVERGATYHLQCLYNHPAIGQGGLNPFSEARQPQSAISSLLFYSIQL